MRSLPENPNIIVEVSQLAKACPGSTKHGYFRCFLPRQETLSEQGYDECALRQIYRYAKDD